MLPHVLSNGICSLNEGQDRLALSCMMDLDHSGKILSHRIANTVINVDRRMTYTAVNAVITDHNPEVMNQYADFVPWHTTGLRRQNQPAGDIRPRKRSRRRYRHKKCDRAE